MPPAGGEHGAVIANVTMIVAQFVKAHQFGGVFGAETGFRIGSHPDMVRAPDIAYVERAKIPPSGIPAAFWLGAPDLAVDVVSPSNTVEGVDEEVAGWLRAGCRVVRVVKPEPRKVEVCRSVNEARILDESHEIDGEDVIPGFHCRVADLFA